MRLIHRQTSLILLNGDGYKKIIPSGPWHKMVGNHCYTVSVETCES